MAKQKIKNSTWFRIPYELFSKYYRLSLSEAVIAGVYYDNGELETDGKMYVQISQCDIAEKLNVSRSTVKRATETLMVCGILKPSEREKGDAIKYELDTEVLQPKQYQIEKARKRKERLG